MIAPFHADGEQQATNCANKARHHMPLLFYLYNIYNHIRPWGKYGHDAVGFLQTITNFPVGHEQQANNRTSSACSAVPLLFYLYTYTMHMRSRQVRARRGRVRSNDRTLPGWP